jgi:CHC2 zinc finger
MIEADLMARARDADIVATAETLGASLKRISSTERAGPCLVCNGTDRFSVNLKKRLWNCRGCSQGGDVVALVQHMRGIDFREAVAFLTGDEARPAPQAPRPAVRPGAEKGDAFVERLIAGIVRELVPPRGTPGEQYLAEARKIDTDAITDVIERTDAIGWHPSVLFREQGHALDGRRLGAIVGIMTDPVTAKPTGAISRTYLAPDLTKVGKASRGCSWRCGRPTEAPQAPRATKR